MLLENDKPGGTVLRRLNKEEYEQSVSDLLKVPFAVPQGFPSTLFPMVLIIMVGTSFCHLL